MTSKKALKSICLECEKEKGVNKVACPFRSISNDYCEEFEIIKKDLERLQNLEKVNKLFLTKYVPLDYLSPNFWESKEEWLSIMNYDYYLFLCEELCDYVVKENRRLNSDEFDLIYKLLKEWLENDK